MFEEQLAFRLNEEVKKRIALENIHESPAADGSADKAARRLSRALERGDIVGVAAMCARLLGHPEGSAFLSAHMADVFAKKVERDRADREEKERRAKVMETPPEFEDCLKFETPGLVGEEPKEPVKKRGGRGCYLHLKKEDCARPKPSGEAEPVVTGVSHAFLTFGGNVVDLSERMERHDFFRHGGSGFNYSIGQEKFRKMVEKGAKAIRTPEMDRLEARLYAQIVTDQEAGNAPDALVLKTTRAGRGVEGAILQVGLVPFSTVSAKRFGGGIQLDLNLTDVCSRYGGVVHPDRLVEWYANGGRHGPQTVSVATACQHVLSYVLKSGGAASRVFASAQDIETLNGYFEKAGVLAPWLTGAVQDLEELYQFAEEVSDWKRTGWRNPDSRSALGNCHRELIDVTTAVQTLLRVREEQAAKL